jgi:hypothetical protein
MNELNRVNVNTCFKDLLALTEAAVRYPDLKLQTDDAKKALRKLKVFFNDLHKLIHYPDSIAQELHQRYELIGLGTCAQTTPATVNVEIPIPQNQTQAE